MSVNRSKKLMKLLDETAEMINPAIFKYTRILDSQMQKILDHALKPKGYRERALLVRLACDLVGGSFTNIIPAAVAVELFHFSTLVIDDILDEAPLRGNFKTVQSAYGYKNAIIIGELLNSLAFLTLMDLINCNIKKDKILKVIRIFQETQRDLYYGQYLDISFENHTKITETQYIDMVSKTTASLLKCSLITGAILGNGNVEQIEGLKQYGKFLGIAFQIRDDLVDIIGEPEVIGKQLGGDIRQGKMRLPIIKALSFCKKSKKRFLINIIEDKHIDESEINKFIEILIESGAIEYCKKDAGDFCIKAIKYLHPLNIISNKKKALIAFAEIIGFLW